MKIAALTLAVIVSALLVKAALSVHWILVLPAAPASVVIVIIALVCAEGK